MSTADFARNQVSDDMIISALSDRWVFTSEVVKAVVGKQIKSVDPSYRARLRRLAKDGRCIAEPCKIPGQERWRLPYRADEIEAQALAGAHYDEENLKGTVVFSRDEWIHRYWPDFMPKPMAVIFGEPGFGKSYASRDQFSESDL